uniref:BED-type domain-containing protein n=1 Tax=Pygocentrus nattereri TaxID=42514 RepID=A0AAR2LSC1_PYGNA
SEIEIQREIYTHEVSQLSTSEEVGSQEDQPTLVHPWPYLEEFFEMVGCKNNSFRMRCKLCAPKYHELMAFKNSPSNLKKHIERDTRNLLQHPLKGSHPLKVLWPHPPNKPSCGRLRVSQASVDKVVLKFIVQGLHPPHVVQQQGFIDLVQHLRPNTNVMTRNTVVNKVTKSSIEMRRKLKAALSEIEFIATTTDCWTAHRRSFIGVTQLKGSHTFSALAGALNDIHTEFNIREKIVRTTTDNGSNFLKAFRIYGQTDENNNPELVGESDGEEDDGGQNDDDDEEESVEGVEFVDAGALLDEDDYLEYQLPKHHRCACHLLNLVSTVDALKAEVNPLYKRVSRSTFAKCSSLWNKSSRSTTASEVIEDHCKLQFLRPVATRWNSLFSAVERIVRITREQGEGALAAVCSELDTPKFTPVELAFLAEYAKTMSPVAKALDVLQGETSVQMGWLVSTITLLRTKLQQLNIASKFCEPLIAALLSGLEKRFGEMLTDPELIAAAILVPKFKTCWTSDENILKLGKCLTSRLPLNIEGSQSSEEEDFFSSLKKTSPLETTQQSDAYLGCPRDTAEVLKSFPAVCQLSLKLNTALPASAACERLFTVAGLIFRPKRAHTGSKNFENQLLLRLNKCNFY